MAFKLQPLLRALNYNFNDDALLHQALSHRSIGAANNERFEFLGDSILNFVIAEALFHQFPDKTEGELSRLRAYLVCGESLANIARSLSLGDYLHLGQGELKSGGFRRESILADALEAVFAAIYLDSHFDACRQVILHCFKEQLSCKSLQESLIDPKTKLQEYLQSKRLGLPIYTLERVSGKDHDQVFHVRCTVKKPVEVYAEEQGPNRRKAEQRAARKVLLQIEKK